MGQVILLKVQGRTLDNLPEEYTEEQYNQEYTKQGGVVAIEELRLERTSRLKKTDHLMVSDFPYPSEDIRTAWVTYRQNLRNIPVTSSTPRIDEDGSLVDIIWPTPPIWPANVV